MWPNGRSRAVIRESKPYTEDTLQVGDLVMMRGCCADDGTFLDVWVPSIWPNVERIAVYGAEGTFNRRQRGLNATAGNATDTLSNPPSD